MEFAIASLNPSHFRSRGWINIWGGAAACFGRGVVATPGKAKEKV